MTQKLSSTAMILAAGLGLRMRPMTLTKPKPLQPIGGRTMLDHALDKLVAAGLKRAVVNTHYLAEQIEDHLRGRKDIEIIISREDVLLDTGGGIAKALPYFEGKPFFALNADLPWIDHHRPSLTRLNDAWNADIMDVLLLLMRKEQAPGVHGQGDFVMEKDGRLRRKDISPPFPFVMIAAQIVKPDYYAHPSKPIFSNLDVWEEAEAHKRLYGLEHDGSCYHVGTPEDWHDANERLASGKGWSM